MQVMERVKIEVVEMKGVGKRLFMSRNNWSPQKQSPRTKYFRKKWSGGTNFF